VHSVGLKAESKFHSSRLKNSNPIDSLLIPQSAIRITPVSLSPRRPIDFFLPPVPRLLPNNALRSELAIELWIDAFAAVIDVQALAALLAESDFMLLADPDGLPVWMISALHRLFTPTPFFSRFETGRGFSRT